MQNPHFLPIRPRKRERRFGVGGGCSVVGQDLNIAVCRKREQTKRQKTKDKKTKDKRQKTRRQEDKRRKTKHKNTKDRRQRTKRQKTKDRRQKTKRQKTKDKAHRQRGGGAAAVPQLGVHQPAPRDHQGKFPGYKD